MFAQKGRGLQPPPLLIKGQVSESQAAKFMPAALSLAGLPSATLAAGLGRTPGLYSD